MIVYKELVYMSIIMQLKTVGESSITVKTDNYKTVESLTTITIFPTSKITTTGKIVGLGQNSKDFLDFQTHFF